MLTWVFWVGSAVFLHRKVTIFTFVITKYLIGREILGDYASIFCYITPSHIDFSIHKWFLRAVVITVIFA